MRHFRLFSPDPDFPVWAQVFTFVLFIFFLSGLFIGSPVKAQSVSCSNDSNVGVSDCTQSECNALGAYWNNSLLSCEYAILGCLDSDTLQFNPLANVDDGSCGVCTTLDRSSCTQSACSSTDGFWDQVDPSSPYCRANTLGCTDVSAVNYDSSATTSNLSACLYCDSSDPGNCTTQVSCDDSGGVWYTDSLSCGLSVVGQSSSLDPANSQSYSLSISPDHHEGVQTRCTSINSDGLCDRWSHDFNEAFLNYLNKIIFLSNVVAIGIYSILFYFLYSFRSVIRRVLKITI